MSSSSTYFINVFAELVPLTGNPLALVPNGDELKPATRAIARQLKTVGQALVARIAPPPAPPAGCAPSRRPVSRSAARVTEHNESMAVAGGQRSLQGRGTPLAQGIARSVLTVEVVHADGTRAFVSMDQSPPRVR